MKKRKIRWKILVSLILGILIMAVAFILISYHTYRQSEIDDCVNYARGLTGLVAHDIVKANDVEGIIRMGRAFPRYKEIIGKLEKLRDAYPDVVYLYAYRPLEDGLHVVFDLDTDEFKGSAPGQVEHYFEAFKPYKQDLLEGKEVPPIDSKEKYGHVLTVLTPMYDVRGVCQCYVGADCSMDQLDSYVRNIIHQVGCFFLIVMGLILIFGILFTDRGVLRPMDRLESKAYRDTLTGLQNRTAYYDYNQVINKKMDEGHADFSILMIDINFLKRMNDEYGHEQGNLYLQGAAELIKKHFGDEHLYRIGGDEFVIILEGKAQEGVEDRIRAFKDEITRLKEDDSLQPWEKVSAAVGIAKYVKGEYSEMEEVLRQADEAMYADKIAMKAVRTV